MFLVFFSNANLIHSVVSSSESISIVASILFFLFLRGFFFFPGIDSSDDTESCYCTSTLDWDSLTDDETYSYLEETLEAVYQRAYNANFFIRKNATSGRWHWVGDSGLMTHEDPEDYKT